jgi:hypothetical protein
MENSEPKKTTGRPRKAATGKAAASKSSRTATTGTVKRVKKPEPTEEEIRAKAQEIYNERVSRGEWGSPEDDWHKAVEAIKKKK